MSSIDEKLNALLGGQIFFKTHPKGFIIFGSCINRTLHVPLLARIALYTCGTEDIFTFGGFNTVTIAGSLEIRDEDAFLEFLKTLPVDEDGTFQNL